MFSRAYRLPASRPVSTQWRDRQSVTRVFQTDDIQQKAETSVNGTAPEQPQDEVSMPSNGPHPRSYAPESTEQPAAERCVGASEATVNFTCSAVACKRTL